MTNQLHSQNQKFAVLPQQIQLLELFHLNGCELQNRIEEELLDNPLLEETETEDGQNDDIPGYAVEHKNYRSATTIPELADFRKELKEELRTHATTEIQLLLAEYLVDSLNDDGILGQELSEMADDFSFQKSILVTTDQMELARQSLLGLEPAGIGCLSIKEFLVMQLQRKNDIHSPLAIELLENNFDAAAVLAVGETDLHKVMTLLSSCKMKPLAESSDPRYSNSITIDFIVTQQDDVVDVRLLRQRSSTLFVNSSLNKMSTGGKSGNKSDLVYMKSKLTSAQWFVKAIQQRETTMLNVMNAIVKFQTPYFKDGDSHLLRPMVLKDISDVTGAHISTISRITCNKYADTPFGTVLLKDLFSKGIENKKGVTVSNKVIQLAIEDAVSRESKVNPNTDQQLMTLLALKGFNIARRTVAKYREQRGIPVVRVRALIAQNNRLTGFSKIVATNGKSPS